MPTPVRRAILVAIGSVLIASPALAQPGVTKYVRFAANADTSYGVLDGEVVHAIAGDLFGERRRTGRSLPLAQVKLLAPVAPSKVIAVGLNYRSHLGNREPAAYPGLFAKFPSTLSGHGDPIVRPADSKNLHYEGEMVIVIGRRASHVPPERVRDYVFGVTAGNDVSERDWQQADLQWFRAKASDGFAPIGPVIATGLNYDDLLVQTRVNGEVRQSERTKDLIFDVATIVSYISRYITLLPGDVIFTGTPQTTRAMQPGDVVEIEVEGVGVLRNPVVDAGSR